MNILFAWIGTADHTASIAKKGSPLGPIAMAVETLKVDKLILIQNHPSKDLNDLKAKGQKYLDWIKLWYKSEVILHSEELANPTHLREIYNVTTKILATAQEKGSSNDQFIFHLSAGTWAMAANWVVLSQTKYSANLVQSSLEDGVKTVEVPFEISATKLPSFYKPSASPLEKIRQVFPLKGFSNKIAKANKYDFPILIESEKGCDQYQLAEAIHNTGPRKDEKFLSFHCNSFSFSSENELKQLLTTVDRGVLFLEKIECLSQEAQFQLESFLKNQNSYQIQGTRINSDVRVIAGTNTDLANIIKNNLFSEELFYLLSGITLKIPALRERPEEIAEIANLILKSLDQNKYLSQEAINVLTSHSWPGNDKELGSTLRRIITFSEGDKILGPDVYDSFFEFRKNVENKSDVLGRDMSDGIDLQSIIGEVSKHYIYRAISKSNGNKAEAAKLVGLSNYQTLSNWIKKYETA